MTANSARVTGTGRFLLFLCLVGTLAWGSPTHAASFIVNSTADAVDATPGDGVCATAEAVCTLRAAIQETNALPGFDTVTLPAGTFTLRIPGANEDAAATGDLDIWSNLLLTGAGATTTIIDGNGNVTGDRVVHILGQVTVSLTGVTIRRGRSPGDGGGLYNNGILTLRNSRIFNNTTPGNTDGGGIYNQGTLTLSQTSLSGNFAREGGGLYSSLGSSATIANSTISSNWILEDSYGNGGGLLNSGTMTIRNSRITDNHAVGHNADGGGIYNAGALAVTNSTFSGNTATRAGGGIRDSGSLTMTNSTLSGNSAGVKGGGIVMNASSSSAYLNNVTLTSNSAGNQGGGIGDLLEPGVVMLRNSLIAENSAVVAPDCATTLTSAGYNLLGDSTGCSFSSADGDQIGTGSDPIDPLLSPLADNGGPTFTHALLDGSPAIDAGNPTGCADDQGNLVTTDQRGFGRPVDGNGDGLAICDIGAYEYGSTPP